jgi:hypothetical protein
VPGYDRTVLPDIWLQAPTDIGTAPGLKFQSGCPDRLNQFVVKEKTFFHPDSLTTKNDPIQAAQPVNRKPAKSMSKIRVLVGTRKGAFILTSDGKRERWKISDPHFAGWEIYHLKGSPAESEPVVCLTNERLVRSNDPTLR